MGATSMVSAFFFFSSRRRHTRYWRDRSSDVCSSDLLTILIPPGRPIRLNSHVMSTRYALPFIISEMSFTGPLTPFTFSSDTLPPLIQLVISEPLQALTRKVMLIQNYYFSANGNTLERQSGNFKRIKAGTDSYQIIFETDPSHKHLSLVTIKNNLTCNSISFDRRFGRIFRRWWYYPFKTDR